MSRTFQCFKRESQAVRARLLVEEWGRAAAGSDATVGALLERWLEAASPDWPPKNALEARRMIRRLLLPGSRRRADG